MEKEVLVNNINELQAGDRVKVINCCWCNKTHYSMCLNFSIKRLVEGPGYKSENTPAIEIVPLPKCSIHKYRYITNTPIEQKRVYLLINEDPIEETVIKSKELEKVE